MKLNTVCVYCGSSPGRQSAYLKSAEKLGKEIARRKICLVYGGASVGLMGEVARSVISNGGKVIGVIPQKLVDQEVAFTELEDLIVVDSMHARKAKMAELADGFIAMPGGFGTFDELFEVLTWAQLGMHAKPCGLLNIDEYFIHLLAFLDHAVKEMFINSHHRDLILASSDPVELLDQMQIYNREPMKKTDWIHTLKKLRRA